MRVPNVHDPEFWQGGPDQELAELRRGCPVALHADAGFWTIAGHDEIVRISKDPATFSSAKGVLIGDLKRTVTGTESILYVDPPRHVAMRRIVNRGFTVRRVAQLTPILEGIVADVLDAIDPEEPVDAVDAICAPVPILMIAHMLGVPAEDLPDISHLVGRHRHRRDRSDRSASDGRDRLLRVLQRQTRCAGR